MKLVDKLASTADEGLKPSSKTADSKTSIIEQGTVIEGILKSNDALLIHGTIKGKIISSSHFTLGEKGSIIGEINAEVAAINGAVEGNIFGKDRIILQSKSSMRGDIISKTIIVEAGALFVGNSKMTEN